MNLVRLPPSPPLPPLSPPLFPLSLNAMAVAADEAELWLPSAYTGAPSLLALWLAHGMEGVRLRDLRALSLLNRQWRDSLHTPRAWRSRCEALCDEAGLYAPGEGVPCWRTLFFDSLWPSRDKWTEDSHTTTLAADFRIRVAVRVRPRRQRGSEGAVVLPLHQRLKMLRRGQKLTFKDAGVGPDELAAALRAQGDTPLEPELLQALLEAHALGALEKQALAQARSGPEGRVAVPAETDAVGLDDGGDEAEAAPLVAATLTELDVRSEAGATPEGCADHAVAIARGGVDAGMTRDEAVTRRGGEARMLLVQPSRVVMLVPGIGIRPFSFPTVCAGDVAQPEVYQRVAQDAVVSALNGLNACVLAYGQTGSGKTHTVFGPAGALDAAAAAVQRARLGRADERAISALPSSVGFVLRTCEELLACRARPGSACSQLHLTAQYVQVYDERLTDLLTGRPVLLREAGSAAASGSVPFVLQGASTVEMASMDDAVALLRAGEQHKRVAATAMNDASSRAHTLFIVGVTQRGRVREGHERVITSQLALVDLAGCEQVKQSRVAGQQFREAVGINSSLLALGKCIVALSEGRRHVPYHESKLTKLLRVAFGGASRTTCIVTASPEDAHADNTLQALRFGERCSNITNTARVSAVSTEEALALVDQALATCEASMRMLEARGRTELPAYTALRARHTSLGIRRRQLGA